MKAEQGFLTRRAFAKGAAIGGAGFAMLGALGLGACSPSGSGPSSGSSSAEGGSSGEGGAYDIVVVGAGIGGLEAGIVAKQAGKSVIVLEKLPRIGGDSILSDGTIHAAGTDLQIEQSIDCGDDDDYIEVRKDPETKHPSTDYPLTHVLYEGAREMVNELAGEGLEFVPIEDWDMWAHNVDGAGARLIEFLSDKAQELGVEIVTDTKVDALLVEDDVVVGVLSGETEYRAPAVVLATGGFCRSEELKEEYDPRYQGVLVVGSAGAEGQGLVMGMDAGAAAVALGDGLHTYIVVPSNYKDMSYPMGSSPGIFVNKSGERFMREDLHYDAAGKRCIEEQDHYGYFVFGQKAVDDYDLLQDYFDAGVVEEFASLADIAQEYGLDKLEDTVAHYNEMMESGKDADFGREWPLEPLEGDKFYLIPGEACVYFSYGGLDVDTSARVLNEAGSAIPGLYACGEVIASPEFREGLVYTSGLSAGYVFGKIAVNTAIADLGL